MAFQQWNMWQIANFTAHSNGESNGALNEVGAEMDGVMTGDMVGFCAANGCFEQA